MPGSALVVLECHLSVVESDLPARQSHDHYQGRSCYISVIISFIKIILQGSLATESAVLKLSGKKFDKPFQGPVSVTVCFCF